MKLKYVKIHADENGETHFQDLEVPMQDADFAPPAPLIAVTTQQAATEILAIGFPPGWFGDFHPAPTKQWMMLMSGTLEVVVSDGEKRTAEVGTIMLLDEAGSKGHTTRVIGDAGVIIMVTQVN